MILLRIQKFFSFLKRKDNPSLMDMFKPLYITLSLLGLCPYTITYPTANNPRVTAKSIILNASCASVMAVFLCIFFGLNVTYYMNITEKIVSMVHINYIIEVLTLISSGIIAYISSFKNRKAYIKILNGISVTWTDLGAVKVKEIPKYFRFHVNLLVFGWLTMLVVPYIIVFCVLEKTQKMFVQKMYTIVPEIVATAVVGFYYVLIIMVGCLLKNIDHQCLQLVNRDVNDETENEKLNTLVRLELAYAKTIEVKSEINRVFEVPIAMMLVQGFHTTLRQAHGLYHMLHHIKNFGVYGMIMAAFFMLYPLSKMLAMTYTGTMLKELGIKIGQSLLSIPVKENDKMIFMEIQHFSKLMQYCDTGISILGFCFMDLNLMFNMIASVVTYFVILVQFDL